MRTRALIPAACSAILLGGCFFWGATRDPTLGSTDLEARYGGRLLIDGNVAYMASSWDEVVSVVDISAPRAPRLVATIAATQPGGLGCRVVEGYLFVAGSAFRVFDVSDPADPVEVFSEDLGPTCDLETQGSYLYLLKEDGTLATYDITDASLPSLVDSSLLTRPTAASYGRLARSDNLLCAIGSQLQVLDVSTPTAPTPRGVVVLPFFPTDIEAKGTYLYAAAAADTMMVINLADGDNPSIVREVTAPLVFYGDLARYGDRLYATTYGGGVVILDVSEPSFPRFKGWANVAPAYVIAASEQYLVGVAWISGTLSVSLRPG
jgi:hypothetical protein